LVTGRTAPRDGQYWWNQRCSSRPTPGHVMSWSRASSTHWPSTASPPWKLQSGRHRRSASAREVNPAARHSGTARLSDPTTAFQRIGVEYVPMAYPASAYPCAAPTTTAAFASVSELHSKIDTGSTSIQITGLTRSADCIVATLNSACWY